jgi:hypothetical protein
MALSGYKYHHNSDGSFDSICPRCFRTIASGNSIEAIATVEAQHQCSEEDVAVFDPSPCRTERVRVTGIATSSRFAKSDCKGSGGNFSE